MAESFSRVLQWIRDNVGVLGVLIALGALLLTVLGAVGGGAWRLAATLTALDENFGELGTTVGALGATVGELSTTADELETTADELETTAGTLSSDVSGLRTTVDTLSSHVGELRPAVGTLSSHVDELGTTVDTLSSDVGELRTAVGTLSSDGEPDENVGGVAANVLTEFTQATRCLAALSWEMNVAAGRGAPAPLTQNLPRRVMPEECRALQQEP